MLGFCAMLIISRTPLRISFFGGGTDYPDYYHRCAGAVLGTTIDKYTHVSVNTIDPFFEYKMRLSYSKTELISHVDEIQHPSIRECLRFLNIERELDIHIFSDLPARTGLGSSSSFTVGFLNALYAFHGKYISKQQLAEEAVKIEQHCIRENVGSQDQFHAAFGGFNIIEFTRQGIQVRPVIMSRENKAKLEDSLMVFFSGMTRHASEILKEQISKTKQQENDTALQEMLSMVGVAQGLLMKGDVEGFGKLLHESWMLKKSLASKVSTSRIDAAYQKAIQAGAWGGHFAS